MPRRILLPRTQVLTPRIVNQRKQEISDLLIACFGPKTDWESCKTMKVAEGWLSGALHPEGVVTAAFVDNRIASVCFGYPMREYIYRNRLLRMGCRNDAHYLSCAATHPDCRGLGLFQLPYELYESEVERLGFGAIETWTRRKPLKRVEVYTKGLGFRELPSPHFARRSGADWIVIGKEL
jgi:hypothetical protein